MQDQPTRDTRRMTPVPGHPGIFKRGERYVVVYRHRGVQRKRSCRTLTEAKRFKGKAAAGEAIPSSSETFASYATRWVKTYAGRTANGVSDATRESYADALTRVAIPFFGTTRLDHIDAPMVRAYIDHVAKLPATKPAKGAKRKAAKAGATVSPSTVRRYYAPVRALLATAYEDGAIPRNVAQGVRVIVRNNRPRTPMRLTPAQTVALLAEMPAEHADLAYLLAATGVRISEALSPTWADLGRDAEGVPTLTITKSKTRAGERAIPLSPETARMLTRRRAAATYGAETDPIFPTEGGTFMDDHNYRSRVFKPAAKRAGVSWATPHKLRHGMASLMAERGYGAAEIATMLGHADGGVLALKTYIHPKARPVDFVDDVLNGGTS